MSLFFLHDFILLQSQESKRSDKWCLLVAKLGVGNIQIWLRYVVDLTSEHWSLVTWTTLLKASIETKTCKILFIVGIKLMSFTISSKAYNGIHCVSINNWMEQYFYDFLPPQLTLKPPTLSNAHSLARDFWTRLLKIRISFHQWVVSISLDVGFPWTRCFCRRILPES